MAGMIADCAACGAQNFVSPERRAVRNPPPACWKCGGVLDLGAPRETRTASPESKQRAADGETSGSENDV